MIEAVDITVGEAVDAVLVVVVRFLVLASLPSPRYI